VSETDSEISLQSLIERAVDGEDLPAAEAEAAIDQFMAGSASPIEMAAFLTALRAKGVAPSEVAGGVRALRKAMVPVVAADPSILVDTAGTGGGAVTTFNISTAAALVAAGAGVAMAKHGNRSFTSRSGSADVLEALGVVIDHTPERLARELQEAGIVFMFAPAHHPAMRHVGPVRRALGFTTLMNILGPLTNPAGARRQVIGVADPALQDLIAEALAELGHIHAMVVHGEPGMDEVSPCGATRVVEVREGTLHDYEVTPESCGLSRVDASELAGGLPAENAETIERVLAGQVGPERTAVLLNAAAAIVVGDAAADMTEGVQRASESIDSGAAAASLERLRAATH